MGVLGPVLLRFYSFMLSVVSGGSQSIVFWRVGVWRIVIHVFRCEWWFAIDGVECCPLVVGVLIVGCEWGLTIWTQRTRSAAVLCVLFVGCEWQFATNDVESIRLSIVVAVIVGCEW